MFLPREYYRISISLYSLLYSKVPLPEALSMCAESSSFVSFKESLKRIQLEIESGKKFSDSVIQESLFEQEWPHMCSVGEMTGSLPSIFHDLSLFYEKQFSERLILLARWTEPVSLFLSAVVILLVALSVLQPMYSIIQYIHPV
jgi:type IV pilus assembly protein PilC